MASHSDRFRPRTGLIPPAFKFPGFQGLCVGGLDGSAYLSSAMNSPAVMVLTSTGGDVTSNTLHVQSQASFPGSRQRLEKDASSPLHVPFTAPSFPMRPLFGQTDPYSGLPTHLLPLHHPLLASHNLSRSYLNAAATGGSFRPLGVQDDRNGFHGSAFVPAKCMKMDQSPTDLSPQHLLIPPCYQSGDSSNFQSPANSHASSSSIHTTVSSGIGSFLDMKDEDHRDSDSIADGPERLSVTPVSEESRSVDRSTPEDRYTPKRPKKLLLDGQTPCCPICGLTIQLPDLSTHFELEVDRLIEIRKCISQPVVEGSPQRPQPFPSPINYISKKDSLLAVDKGKPESRWETYQRVKCNRQNRLSARACGGKKKKTPEEVAAEAGGERLNGMAQEIAARMMQCIRKREHPESEDDMVDVDGQIPEDFDWALAARMHSISQMQRGALESFPRKFDNVEDENQELNVDGDDSATYGQPHYTEADVITCSTEEKKDKEDFRRIQTINDSSNYQKVADSTKWNINGASTNGEGQEVTSTCVNSTDHRDFDSEQQAPAPTEATNPSKEHIEDTIKCLICMEPFIKPVVSVCCWHVHCEECWLKTLGTKKLCPQCNMITSARDLRRIYL